MAIEEESDGRPKPAVSHMVGSDLSTLSLHELADRIALLEREIERIRAEEVRKGASRDAASAFFKI